MNRGHNNQSGLVSILTVMFLMIFLSILVVGFIKIVGDEQRQATDNDLSASAQAAARAGIEDGKRILLYCRDNPGGPCTTMLTSGAGAGDCTAFTDNNTNGVMNPLNISRTAAEGARVGDVAFNQYYTCLTINKDTQDIQQVVNEGRSDIQHLRLTSGALSSLKVIWTRQDKGVQYAQHLNNTIFNTSANWKSGTNPYPPILRLQFIPFTPGNIDLEASETGSRTLFLVPGRAGAPGVSAVALSDDARVVAGQKRPGPSYPAKNISTCTTGDYTCTVDISGFTGGTTQYYIRTTVIYSGGATTLVTLQLPAGQTFDSIQPVIDATGRTNDVYRRIRARVSFQVPGAAYPEYALETGATYCKDITVADVASSSYNCPPTP